MSERDAFTVTLVTVKTARGRTYRRVFIKSEAAKRYARGACAIGGSATVKLVDVQPRPAS